MLQSLAKLSTIYRRLGIIPLRDSLADMIDRVLIRINKPPVCIKIDEFQLCGFLRHARFLDTLTKRGFEPLARKLTVAYINHDTLVVDGGAHIGLYSLMAASLVGKEGRVFAFEPDPFNFRTLLFNIEKNQCTDKVVLFPKALADKSGIQIFHQAQSSLSGSLVDRFDVRQRATLAIETTTLDKELAGKQIRSLFIKLDLEGAEPMALAGMRKLLRTVPQVAMIIEVNPDAMASANLEPEVIVRELEQLGFTINYIDEKSQQLLSLNSIEHLHKGNLFCTKGYSNE